MIIDCISDLHGFFPELRGGDLLIVAGDLTASDADIEYFEIFHWISQQKYNKKIVIAGNHDIEFAIASTSPIISNISAIPEPSSKG